MSDVATNPEYILGHDEAELERLTLQHQILGDLTESFLRSAGIAPGMTVLDIGCGPGDVTFLAARLVGSRGRVLGIDRSEEAIRLAGKRAGAAGLDNVSFLQSDLESFMSTTRFDAIVGRLVLLYVGDPGRVLRGLRHCLHPRGVVAIQEFDMEVAMNGSACPTFTTHVGIINETFRRAGMHTAWTRPLVDAFQDAGLPTPHVVRYQPLIVGPHHKGPEYLTATLRSLLPFAEKLAVVTPTELDLETLPERVRREMEAADAILPLPALVGAVARTPGDAR